MAHEFKAGDLVRDKDDHSWTGVLHLGARYWWVVWDNNNKSSPRFPRGSTGRWLKRGSFPNTIPFDALIEPIVRD
jgi:hypothetical protein